jgi:regulator of protease activity HflC (stomatin/prohibitin superfamily)
LSDEEEPREVPDTEALLHRVADLIEGTRAIPLSSSAKLDNKDEVLDLLEEARARVPEEVRQARWMMKEREEYLHKTQREGEDILEAARLRAERMVQRTEIVREAQHTARRIVEEAEDVARRLRLEAEDYCDQKLAAFEIVLERTLKTAHAGRQKLAVTPSPTASGDSLIAGMEPDDTVAEDAFFDQDRG